MLPLPERQWINQYDPVTLGVVVYVNGVPGDPAGSLVTATMTNEQTGAAVFTGREAERVEAGVYQVTLAAAETSVVGSYSLRWGYVLGSTAQFSMDYLEIGPFSPDYAALAQNMRAIVETTWNRFEDLFDSPLGGPHLQVYVQSHFSRGRMAQLLRIALGRLNTASQPFQTYTLDGDGGETFPVAKWGPLLEQALYVETLKHLRRSYVEQPTLQGGEVTRHDRRDYMDRWSQVLADEAEALDQQLEVFKIAAMRLGRPALLVSGGVYGRMPALAPQMGTGGRPRFYRIGY